MTRLAVMADIHANLAALEAVLEDAREQHVERLVVAGDSVLGGPQPMEAMRLLRSLGAWMIRGNNEGYLVAIDTGQAPAAWHESAQWAVTRWGYAHLDREALDHIASLPESRTIALPGAAAIRIVHGSPQGCTGRLFPDRDPGRLRWFARANLLPRDPAAIPLAPALAGVAEPVLVCAHTHIPWQQEEENCLALNPGSVGAPLDGELGAEYALLSWGGHRWQVELRAVPYDLGALRAAYRESGLLAEGGSFARACLLGTELGLNAPGHFVTHAYRLAARAGFGDCETVPDAIWEQAAATFDWDTGELPGAGLEP